MVTYADLVTLLLVFFVMLFSMSTLDLIRFREIAAQLRNSFGNPTKPIILIAPDVDQAPEEKPTEPREEEQVNDIPAKVLEELDPKLLMDLQELVKKERIGEHIVVYQEKNRITIVVEGQVFFDTGHADLRPEALPILDEIAKIIENHPHYKVNIKGHTDDRPISTVQFPSNWELSAVRATTVLRYFLTKGIDPRRVTATGYGSFVPIAPNDSDVNRSKNRRVEFVLEKEQEG